MDKLSNVGAQIIIQHIYDTSDGELCILINGTKYSYFLDTAGIQKILRKLEKSPGKTLKEIKNSARYYYKHEK